MDENKLKENIAYLRENYCDVDYCDDNEYGYYNITTRTPNNGYDMPIEYVYPEQINREYMVKFFTNYDIGYKEHYWYGYRHIYKEAYEIERELSEWREEMISIAEKMPY